MAETEADVWRTYDQVVPDKNAEVFVRALDAVVDELEGSTPLLMPLANALRQYLPWPGMWDVAERRRRLTYDFIAVDVPSSEHWEEVRR